MNKFVLSLILTGFMVILPEFCSAVDSWPGGIGTVIATFPDASGAVWHLERQSIFVIQNSGRLNEIDTDGNILDYWDIAGDLEGITLAENNRYLYLGIEHPDSIVEFDLQTEALTGKSWDLTTWMSGPDNSGLEGLVYRNGYFLAGLQADGKIYVFNVNLNVSGTVSYDSTITPYASYSDIAGLEYNSSTGIIYAIFDTADALIELNSDNEVVNHYTLPGSAQEGIVVHPSCLSRTAQVYITNDDTGQVIKYPGYPVTCLDADSDGIAYATDCNDYDANISANQTYYQDADGDSLGSDVTTSVCSLSAPVGYVTNSNDQNDSDYDNDSYSAGTDCNDADGTIYQNQTYYRDADSDGLGDINTTTAACAFTAPAGYVSNSNDTVDLLSSGQQMYINGSYHQFFTVDPASVQYANLNYYNDDYEEIIAVALKRKRAYITVARVCGTEVIVVKRVMIKKRYRTVQIINQLAKNKFITKFNGKKKYTWKIKSSGLFKRSK